MLQSGMMGCGGAILVVAICGCHADVELTSTSSSGTSSGGAGGNWALSTSATTADSSSSSGGAASLLDFHGGSRLELRYFEADDGASLYSDIHDKKLDAVCSFATAVDGASRCLPYPSASVYFADDACSKPLVDKSELASVGTTFAAYVVGQVVDCVANPLQYYSADPKGAVVTSGKVYGYDSDGICVEAGPAASANHPYVTAKEMDSSEFVAQTTEEVDGGGDLNVLVANGDDGSRSLLSLASQKRKVACMPGNVIQLSTSFPACVPIPISIALLYADSDCKTPAAYQETCGDSTYAIIDYDSVHCVGPGTLYLPGSPVPAKGFVMDVEKGCVLGGGATGTITPVAGLASPSDFSAMPDWKNGTGAVTALYAGSSTGFPLAPVTLSNDGIPCTAQKVKSGWRCIPGFAPLANQGALFYADSKCSQPAVYLGASTHGCTFDLPAFTGLAATDGTIDTLYAVGAVLSGKSYYQADSKDGCKAMAMDNNVLVGVGAEADVTQFPALTRVAK